MYYFKLEGMTKEKAEIAMARINASYEYAKLDVLHREPNRDQRAKARMTNIMRYINENGGKAWSTDRSKECERNMDCYNFDF